MDKILKDPSTNIYWLPDVVERKLYENIATVALNAIESTLDTSQVNFLGHKLRFIVDPMDC